MTSSPRHTGRTPTLRQAIAWTIALLAIAAALLLVAVGGRPRRPWHVIADLVRGGVRHARPVDAVVGVVLGVWLVIGPALWDDGFVLVREQMFSVSGGFSIYYTALGANVPLGYWLEWLQHWLTESSTSLLVMRIPALVCLGIAWALCRWMLSRVLGSEREGRRVALWALAATFLTFALAWNMTLRPEPATALLAIAVMAAAIRFLERPTATPLVVAALLVPLALTAHHTGVVALAPLVAILPALLRFARSNVPLAATVVTASLALLLVLMFIGADIEQRRADVELTRTYGVGLNWREEATRYVLLSSSPYGTSLRRGSVALIAIAVIAFLARRRRADGDRLLNFPSVTLLATLVLLVLTPSKWPWHFGAVLGIASLAVAAESARLRRDAARISGWSSWPLLALGVAAVVASWVWWPRARWNKLDIRTLDWTPAFESVLPLSTLAALAPVLLLSGMLTYARLRGSRTSFSAVSSRVASWTAPILAAPLILFTGLVLVSDAAKTSGWTLARQNVETLGGGAELRPGRRPRGSRLRSSFAALRAAGAGTTSALGPAPAPPVAGLPRFALAPVDDAPRRPRAWFVLLPDAGYGLFVSGHSPAALRPVSARMGPASWQRHQRTRDHAVDLQREGRRRRSHSVALPGRSRAAWRPRGRHRHARHIDNVRSAGRRDRGHRAGHVRQRPALGPTRRGVEPVGASDPPDVLPLRRPARVARRRRRGPRALRHELRPAESARLSGDEPVRRRARPLPAPSTFDRRFREPVRRRAFRGRPAHPGCEAAAPDGDARPRRSRSRTEVARTSTSV